MLTTLSPRDYFVVGDRFGTPLSYFLWNISLNGVRGMLPGLFPDNTVKFFVNASLWTIPYEAKMYLCVAAAGMLGLFRFPRLTSIAIAGVFAKIVLWPMYTGTVHMAGVLFFGLQLCGFFGAGAIACLMRQYVPISTGLLVLIVGMAMLMRESVHHTPFTWLAVGYFVLWFAYVPRVPSIPRGLDLSYGTYLWAFPVQQVVVMYTGVREPLLLFAIVTPIVLAIAMASWLLVEKPALRLKDWHWRRRAVALQPT
jgi:peptidoglycan/LPS O-acetylase OafA/YrhL